MTTLEDAVVVDVPVEERAALEPILDESFEGWYLRHSKGTLRDVDEVRAALLSGSPVGLIMLKTIEPGAGYVYYIAVAKARRRMGIGKLLLDDALRGYRAKSVAEVFASVEEDNVPSQKLFESQGFSRTSFGEISKKHGSLRTLNMYRKMLTVPGEFLLRKELS